MVRRKPWFTRVQTGPRGSESHSDPRVTPFPKSGNPHHLPYSLHVPEVTKFNPRVLLSLSLVYKVRLGLRGIQFSVCHRRCILIMSPIPSFPHNLVST